MKSALQNLGGWRLLLGAAVAPLLFVLLYLQLLHRLPDSSAVLALYVLFGAVLWWARKLRKPKRRRTR